MTKRLFKISSWILIVLLMYSMVSVSGQEDSVEFTLSVNNLADPGDDHYEGWFITADGATSTGKFSVNSDGAVTDLEGNEDDSFTVDNVNLDDVSEFVITLEPSGDTDTNPAAIKPVAGDFNEDKTSAALTHNIGADFSSISGDYILATPTDGTMNTNENSGIWYLSLETGSPTVAFDLPDLSGTDWIYEGWVVVDGYPLTTGTFDEFNVVDNDDPFSDTTASGPPFPGEDYLQNAPSSVSFPLDLAGQITAITIEPRMDNSAAPFQFHVLEDQIPTDATDHVTYSMDDISNTLPSGTVDIMESDDGFLPFTTFGLVGVALLTVVALGTKLRKKLD